MPTLGSDGRARVLRTAVCQGGHPKHPSTEDWGGGYGTSTGGHPNLLPQMLTAGQVCTQCDTSFQRRAMVYGWWDHSLFDFFIFCVFLFLQRTCETKFHGSRDSVSSLNATPARATNEHPAALKRQLWSTQVLARLHSGNSSGGFNTLVDSLDIQVDLYCLMLFGGPAPPAPAPATLLPGPQRALSIEVTVLAQECSH